MKVSRSTLSWVQSVFTRVSVKGVASGTGLNSNY